MPRDAASIFALVVVLLYIITHLSKETLVVLIPIILGLYAVIYRIQKVKAKSNQRWRELVEKECIWF